MTKGKRLDRRNKCAFCTKRTITEKNQPRYADNSFQALCTRGLLCRCCKEPRFICLLCIVAIVDSAEDKEDSIILYDPWIAALRLYLDLIKNRECTDHLERNFQGNCCDNIGNKPNRTEVVVKCDTEPASPLLSYDGGLVLLGHGILIETDCDAVDVNAMGPDELAGIGKGIVHGVIDSSLARQLHMEGYAPNERDSNFKTTMHNIVIPSVSPFEQEQKVSTERYHWIKC
jgi:hypothetical protein